MPRVNPARDWIWTCYYGIEDEQLEALRAFLVAAVEQRRVRYAVWQRERGELGRLHSQGFIRFRTNMRRNAVGRFFQEHNEGYQGIHLEERRGTPEEAKAYASKEDTRSGWGPCEVGRFIAGAGRRSDLETVRERLDAGATQLEIATDFFGTWCRYNRAFRLYSNLRAEARTDPPEVRVYNGPAGSGKSRMAWDEFPHLYPVPVPAHRGQPWFDEYEGQEAVLIDDYLGNEYDLGFLLKLLDRYPLRVPVKCAFVTWVPKVIIITTNVHPDLWYPEASVESRRALRRRITRIVNFRIAGDGGEVVQEEDG